MLNSGPFKPKKSLRMYCETWSGTFLKKVTGTGQSFNLGVVALIGCYLTVILFLFRCLKNPKQDPSWFKVKVQFKASFSVRKEKDEVPITP
jgi:hypothetical protein